MARIQKGQTYEDLGFRVDDRGIAYDLATGAGLPKSVVDQRLAGSGMSQLAKSRGGIAGVFDRNKKIIKPVAQLGAGALGFLAGGPAGAAAAGGATGAAFGGFDREGKGGVGFDAKQGLMGGAKGAVLGSIGGALPGIVAAGQAGAAGGGGLLGGIGAAGKAALPAVLGAGGQGGLPSLGTIGSGIGNALTGNGGMNALAFAQLFNSAQLGKKSGDLADEALNTQRDLFANKAPLRSAGIAGMQAPRTELPQLAKLGAVGNPFSRTV